MVYVDIEVKDESVFERVTGPEGDEFRRALYPLHTRQDVLDHWAYNCIANGVQDANRLDGWADLEDSVVIMRVTDVQEGW